MGCWPTLIEEDVVSIGGRAGGTVSGRSLDAGQRARLSTTTAGIHSSTVNPFASSESTQFYRHYHLHGSVRKH